MRTNILVVSVAFYWDAGTFWEALGQESMNMQLWACSSWITFNFGPFLLGPLFSCLGTNCGIDGWELFLQRLARIWSFPVSNSDISIVAHNKSSKVRRKPIGFFLSSLESRYGKTLSLRMEEKMREKVTFGPIIESFGARVKKKNGMTIRHRDFLLQKWEWAKKKWRDGEKSPNRCCTFLQR